MLKSQNSAKPQSQNLTVPKQKSLTETTTKIGSNSKPVTQNNQAKIKSVSKTLENQNVKNFENQNQKLWNSKIKYLLPATGRHSNARLKTSNILQPRPGWMNSSAISTSYSQKPDNQTNFTLSNHASRLKFLEEKSSRQTNSIYSMKNAMKLLTKEVKNIANNQEFFRQRIENLEEETKKLKSLRVQDTTTLYSMVGLTEKLMKYRAGFSGA